MKKNSLVLLIILLATISVYSESGYKMWLRYQPIQNKNLKESYSKYCANISVTAQNEILTSAIKELQTGISGMLGFSPETKTNTPKGIIIRKLKNLPARFNIDPNEMNELSSDGYKIKSGADLIIITSKTDAGLLYGVFHLLRLMQMNQPVSKLDIAESPKVKLRLLNQWDNPGIVPEGRPSVERGYAGETIFKWNELPEINQRYIDYARYLASVGINGTVINNVNTAKNGLEGWKLLTPEYLPKLKALADVFRKYGIRLYISVNFFSPVLISKVADADPFNPTVQKWWKNKVADIYKEIPDFGGFLVKADSEGEPGPIKYGRTHADGANLLANALKPYGGVVFWRAFVYSSNGKLNPDRACQAYEMFKPLDGKFAENAILQIKNGPIDFQVREPVSPLFGAMPKTNEMMELQITQEYTGHAKHVCFLVPQWKEILDFDTYAKGAGSTVKRIVEGNLFGYRYAGIAGVSNLGDNENWTGHLLAQANTYGFGRLAWNPDLTSEEITNEWIEQTFGNIEKVKSIISKILQSSWITYEDYTSPLGVGLMCNGGSGDEGHFFPAPADRTKYHKADKNGVGYNRTYATGSGFTSQYFEPIRSEYENVNICPDELLLFIHHVPYKHRLHSGETVIQHIYNSHNQGVENVNEYISEWKKLEGLMDNERYNHVLRKLTGQLKYAEEWRDSVNTYFYELSGIKPLNE
jgi:alpha-glucuronidase